MRKCSAPLSLRNLFSTLLVWGLLLFVVPFHAQSRENFTPEELRAAYLTSVTQYVTWPNESARNTLVIGVLGTSEVYEELARAPLSEVRGMRLEVRSLSRASQLTGIDLVYVAPNASNQLNAVFNTARIRPLLVITEHNQVREDMMINLIAPSPSRLAFQVNPDRINESGLRASNDLLVLRGSELESAVQLRRAQIALAETQRERNALSAELENLRQQNNQLLNRIDILEQTVRERDSVLRAQQGTLEDKQQVMESQQSALQELLAELDEQRQLLLERETQLQEIQRTLSQSERALLEQQQQLRQKEFQLRQKQVESDELAERIATNRTVLAAQQQQLRDQRAALVEQQELLESRERTIDRQRVYLWTIGVVFLFVLVFLLTTVILFFRSRRQADQLRQTLEELHEAQDKLVESEKMAALGNLVAGVAHEVNTPLGVAITATSMVHDRLHVLDENLEQGKLSRESLKGFIERASESLSLTQKNLTRVGALITNFKQIAVDQMVAEQREIDLKVYLEEVMSTLSIELRRAGIEYDIAIPDEIKMTTIPGAMAQIITNLVTNAIRHAFTEPGGHLKLQAESIAGHQVRLTFTDNGAGMEADILNRIFDPFFTTKRNAGGTGLGMPIVYNLVRQKLKGDISVTSTPGKGTTFTLLLPKQL